MDTWLMVTPKKRYQICSGTPSQNSSSVPLVGINQQQPERKDATMFPRFKGLLQTGSKQNTSQNHRLTHGQKTVASINVGLQTE
jgi:hypothetical protein